MAHVTGVSIMIPTGTRSVVADTAVSIYDLGQLLAAEGIPSRPKWMGCSDIVDLRNLFLTLWYYKQPQSSHLLMIDSDMRFSPFMVWDMLQFGKPVTGCFYAKREYPIAVVGKALNDTDTVDDVVDGHLRVSGVGAGVLLIKRTAIQEMIDKLPEIIVTTNNHALAGQVEIYELPHLLAPFKKVQLADGGELSEDISFCHRWRQCGGEVWANVRHPVGHIGPHEWLIRYEDYLIKRKKGEDAPQEIPASEAA
jgi:hypothetical protein